MERKLHFIFSALALLMTAGVASGPLPAPVPFIEQEPEWELVSRTTLATVYNAVPSQCNKDNLRTASMYRIRPESIESDRILAMERTMMAEYGISYGDSVLVRHAGKYDGVWRVHDTMNKRFRGQHRIDFLVPNHIRHGRWSNVLVYKKINQHGKDT